MPTVRRPRCTPPRVEALEPRDLPSSVLWVNRGGPAADTDGFGLVFGSRAELARATVDAALASWQAVITGFHYADGSDTLRLTINADPTDRTNGAETWAGQATDGAGRPEAGTIHIGAGPDGKGGRWFLDPNPSDTTAFNGSLWGACARDAAAGSAASDQADLYSVIIHEVTHALGLAANPYLAFRQDVHGDIRATGVPDSSDGPGMLYTFTAPGVSALLTSDDGAAVDAGAPLHVAPAGASYTDPATGRVYTGAVDALNPVYAWGRRTLISTTDSLILEAAYGYATVAPRSFLSGMTEPLIVTGADAGGGPQVGVFKLAGTPVRAFFAYDPRFTGGVRTGVGDVTGDGVRDDVTAPGPGMAPEVKVYDGATGALVRDFLAYDVRFQSGVFVATGDVNGDGYADIVTGADRGGGPHVKVFSGKDGSLLASFYAYSPLFPGGVRVAAADVNGDGFADVITGAGPGGGPHVEAFSGKDGRLLRSFMAYNPAFSGGVYVAGGDLTGDGRADIITGAGAGGGAQVAVFNGSDGAIVRSFLASAAASGEVRVAAVDVNGDGAADVVTAGGPGAAPAVTAYDGSRLTVLDDFYAFNPLFTGGVFLGGG